ncbi:sensor histidine kinase [Runella slithyformis]|nr:ATP-binding protein [Runella slithyformis]
MRKPYLCYLIFFCFIYLVSDGRLSTVVAAKTVFALQSIQNFPASCRKNPFSHAGNSKVFSASYCFFFMHLGALRGYFMNPALLFLLLFSRPSVNLKLSSPKSRLNFHSVQIAVRRWLRPVWIYSFSVAFLLLFYAFTLFLVNTGHIELTFSGLIFFQVALTANMFIIIIGLTYLHWVYENKHRKSQWKTRKQQKKLHDILQLKQQEEVRRIRLQQELQVQRERLARDLHDGIGSQLTHIVTKLDMLSIRSAQARQLGLLSDFARETNQILRETIWVLNHDYIEYTQFQQRMSGFMNRLWEDREQPELKISMSDHSSLLISPVVAMTIFRIGQEVINNALKYAEADCINIHFRQRSNTVVVEINDNGTGFDLQKVKRGYGLDNIQKRCSELGGQLLLYSAPTGTTVMIELPPSEPKPL